MNEIRQVQRNTLRNSNAIYFFSFMVQPYFLLDLCFNEPEFIKELKLKFCTRLTYQENATHTTFELSQNPILN